MLILEFDRKTIFSTEIFNEIKGNLFRKLS